VEVEDKSLDKYYAIARGKNVGIFTEWKTVQENMKGYPNPLYKKHSTYDEALAYFKKFNGGEGESKGEKRKLSSDKSEEEKIVPKKKAK
jgi:ribonuclease HI